MKYFFILLFLIIFFLRESESQGDRVFLRDVTSLTLRRGDYTNGRRSSSIPQLQCIGGTAYGSFAPKVVQCYNRGFDGTDVQWECKAPMGSDFEFGKIEVSCEGYGHPNDPYILAGSCGLRYELDYTTTGARKYSSSPFSKESSGISTINIIYFIIACFVIYLIYTTLTSPRDGDEGDRNRRGGGGFDHGPGYPPGGPPPPGWRQDPPPTYDDSCKYNSANTQGCGSSSSANNNRGSGPGFFSGIGLGALGGYLFGQNYTGYGSTYRRRGGHSGYGYNQFDHDTGFYNEPSTSYRSHSSSHGSHSSGGTHTSSGFGGTSRR